MDDHHTVDHPDQVRYQPTTTHAEWGAGHPRLRIANEYDREDDRFVHDLTADVTRIGSADGSEVLLAGADALHASIVHDAHDEYVLTMHGPGVMNAKPESHADYTGDRTETLRSGARFTIGPWELVFMRDEFADHGRPYGGRQGGEGAHQHRQPDRPDYGASPRPADAV